LISQDRRDDDRPGGAVREQLDHRELRRAREHEQAHRDDLGWRESGLPRDDAEWDGDDDGGEHRPALGERGALR
jgi:hypothetical protein